MLVGRTRLSLLRKIVGFETIRVSGDCGGSAAAIVGEDTRYIS